MRQPLGQHFLRDPRAVKTILAAAELKPTDIALEIGPGKGILTFDLAQRVKRLVAIELDASLASRLKERLPQSDVIRLDILKADLDALFPEEQRPIKILGNLPYSITSAIFEKVMPWPGWDVGVFLIQREVADRIVSPPGSRTYGILSLAIQLFVDVETVLQLKPGAFLPPPKVSSTVIRLRRKKDLKIAPQDIPAFFDLVHGAFAHRRKTIVNSLSHFSGIPRVLLEAWLCQYQLSANARAETLSLDDYARLAAPWSIFRRENDLT